MTLKEVRTILRDRNLNPGGSQGSLVERYLEAVASGHFGSEKAYGVPNSFAALDTQVVDEKDRAVFRTVNNYSRPDGQNTGNYMTDRCA
eukprot:1191080-Prorocentrum_minimum.AAC.6